MDIRWLPVRLPNDKLKPLSEIKEFCHNKRIPLKVENGVIFIMVNTEKYDTIIKQFKK